MNGDETKIKPHLINLIKTGSKQCLTARKITISSKAEETMLKIRHQRRRRRTFPSRLGKARGAFLLNKEERTGLRLTICLKSSSPQRRK